MPIEAPTANLSTLDGGYIPFREGGGNQSNSLRLKTQDGQEFVMRGVKKSAVRFLNNMAFKKSTFGNELDNTFPENSFWIFIQPIIHLHHLQSEIWQIKLIFTTAIRDCFTFLRQKLWENTI
jgi:hypothetical protein